MWLAAWVDALLDGGAHPDAARTVHRLQAVQDQVGQYLLELRDTSAISTTERVVKTAESRSTSCKARPSLGRTGERAGVVKASSLALDTAHLQESLPSGRGRERFREHHSEPLGALLDHDVEERRHSGRNVNVMIGAFSNTATFPHRWRVLHALHQPEIRQLRTIPSLRHRVEMTHRGATTRGMTA